MIGAACVTGQTESIGYEGSSLAWFADAFLGPRGTSILYSFALAIVALDFTRVVANTFDIRYRNTRYTLLFLKNLSLARTYIWPSTVDGRDTNRQSGFTTVSPWT